MKRILFNIIVVISIIGITFTQPQFNIFSAYALASEIGEEEFFEEKSLYPQEEEEEENINIENEEESNLEEENISVLLEEEDLPGEEEDDPLPEVDLENLDNQENISHSDMHGAIDDEDLYRFVQINQDAFEIQIRVNKRTGITTSIFTLEDKEGNHVYTYCADSTTPPYPYHTYKRENLEDAKRVEDGELVSYYSNEDAAKLRAVLNYGFQLADKDTSFNDFVALGLPGVMDLTKEELIAATQAAVYTETNHAVWVDDQRLTFGAVSGSEWNSLPAGILSFYIVDDNTYEVIRLTEQQQKNIESVYKYIVEKALANPIGPSEETDIFISEKLESSNISQKYDNSTEEKTLADLKVNETILQDSAGDKFLITRVSNTEYKVTVYYDFSHLKDNSDLDDFTIIVSENTDDNQVVKIPLTSSNELWSFDEENHIGKLELIYSIDPESDSTSQEFKVDIEGIQKTMAGYYLYQSAKDGFMSDHGAQNFVGWANAGTEPVKAKMEFNFTIPKIVVEEPPEDNDTPPTPPSSDDNKPEQPPKEDDTPPPAPPSSNDDKPKPPKDPEKTPEIEIPEDEPEIDTPNTPILPPSNPPSEPPEDLFELGPDGLPLSNLELKDPTLTEEEELFDLDNNEIPRDNMNMLDPMEELPQTGAKSSFTWGMLLFFSGLGLLILGLYEMKRSRLE